MACRSLSPAPSTALPLRPVLCQPSFYPQLAALQCPQRLGLGPGDAGHLGSGCQREEVAGHVYWGWLQGGEGGLRATTGIWGYHAVVLEAPRLALCVFG